MTYLLMNKDSIVASFTSDVSHTLSGYKLNEIFGRLPYGFEEINAWLESRQAAKHRNHLYALMKKYGCDTVEGFIKLLHCTGINDTFWVKREDEYVTWKDVSLYSNEFDNTITSFAFEGAGLQGEEFSSTSPEFSIDGAYEKCCIRESDNLYLIKRGVFVPEHFGLEAYCECFSYPIYNHIVDDAVAYDLIKFHDIIASKCKLFTTEDIGFVPISRLFKNTRSMRGLFSYYDSIGASDRFRAMLVADAVCFNNDRHGGNHGVLVNNDTQEIITMAPIFDHNCTLLPEMQTLDFYESASYIAKCKTRIGDSWISTAREVLTPEIRQKLVNLRGYEIPWNGDDNFSRDRAQLLSKLINVQIEEILK